MKTKKNIYVRQKKKKNVSLDRLDNIRRITRLKSLENGSEGLLPIPIDIIITIFSKLNLKSIARCRCVSKLWASILRHSDFTELFLSTSRSSSPKILIAYLKNKELLFFSSPQPQYPDENLSPVLANHQMNFSCDSYVNIDRVHGLIYLTDFEFLKKNTGIVGKICNPSTGQILNLPKVRTYRNIVWSLLGYDPIGKQFKVLAMTQPQKHNVVCDEIQVLTLGSEKFSWRKKECCVPHNYPHKNICINGVLYYLSIDRLAETHSIVCFDVRFEKFIFIKTMETLKGATRYGSFDLINYNGKLCLLYVREEGFILSDERSIKLKLCVLEDHIKHEWSEHMFVFSTLPKNVILRYVGVTKKTEFVFSSNRQLYLFYLNLEKNAMVRFKIQGLDGTTYGIKHIFLDHVEDVKLYGSLSYFIT